MALVKNYGLSTTDDVAFNVVFAIPNNCDYAVTTNTGKHYVTVALKKGQTVPSTTYINCSINLSAISDILDVNFQQVLGSITSTKPKMKVDNCM